MSRPKTDRRPVRANSVATGPAREIPAGWFKCRCCGKTLPWESMQADLPEVWTSCRACWAKSLDTRDKFRNPGAH